MDITLKLEQVLDCKIQSYQRGGRFDIAHLEDGRILAVKRDIYSELEGRMLQILGDHLPCVEVYFKEKNLLAMEYIEDRCDFDEADAAQALARLHQVTSERYGFEFDTTIGSYPQPNPWEDSWSEFFIQHRLLPLANACYQEAKVPLSAITRIENLIPKLPDLIPSNPGASLIHGDVWSGNILCKQGQPVFIDPATYYAHHEMELAFIQMFHTFGERFFAAYREIMPIESDFYETRASIYMLYPILVHVRSFGGMYRAMLDEKLNLFD